MQVIETVLDFPRVKAARIRFWFGRKKGFPRVAQLVVIAEHGAPVHFDGSTDIGAALAYSNHRSVAPHSDFILAKLFDDVRFADQLFFRAAKRTPSPICGHTHHASHLQLRMQLAEKRPHLSLIHI